MAESRVSIPSAVQGWLIVLLLTLGQVGLMLGGTFPTPPPIHPSYCSC